MAKLAIIKLPDPILRRSRRRSSASTTRCANWRPMLETMYAAPVGLAAVQVGVSRRLIVLDTAKGRTSRRARSS